MAGPDGNFNPGEVVDLPDSTAQTHQYGRRHGVRRGGRRAHGEAANGHFAAARGTTQPQRKILHKKRSE
jgi:hypothetical protein